MPDLGYLHPIVVHFTVTLLIVGVLLRWVSLTGKVPFAGPAALLFLLLGTATTFLAVQSGTDAHGPAERIPGVRPLVHEHEEHGEQARDVFLVVSLFEIIAFVLAQQKNKRARLALGASALVGTLGMVALVAAAQHGGELVYSYAGGVGTRTGDPEDVKRLFLAGLYHQARVDREAGRPEQAAQLMELADRRFRNDMEIRLLYASSLLEDRKNPQEALLLLQQLNPPPGDFLELRRGVQMAKALQAQGNTNLARKELERLQKTFPQSRMLKRAFEEL
jgi:uncharacterized membrane protein